MPLELNPYTPPKTSVVNPNLESNTLGYRDGDHLMVKENFIGPRVCVVTGDETDKSTPIPVQLRSRTPWQDMLKPFNLIMILLCLSYLGFNLYTFNSISSSLGWTAFFPLVLLFSILHSSTRTQGGAVHVFCSPQILKSRQLRSYFRFVPMFAGIILLIIIPMISGTRSSNLTIIGFVLLFINWLPEKKLLKSRGREGEYQRFSGAHPNFLKALEEPNFPSSN
ncbi:MAG: hypothetical protein ACSHX6_11410 [Akkermansiaceae bacterium]